MSSINAQIRTASDNGEEVTSRYTPVKKTAWDSFKSFWMTYHNLRRHPFAAPGHPKRPVKKSSDEKSFWASFKDFWMTHHNLRRHPFASKM